MQRVRRASAAATEACGPGGLPRAQTQRRGFLAFISRVAASEQDSDVEDIKTDRSRQVPVSESSPEQSYGLDRDRHLSGGCPDPHFSECENDDF